MAGLRKTAGNIEINRGSILLLFTDDEAAIVRNWRHNANRRKTTVRPASDSF